MIIRKMLIVEDAELYAGMIRRDFLAPPRDWAMTQKVSRAASVELAQTRGEAEAVLMKAHTDRAPFDVVVVDLGLPTDGGNPFVDMEEGFKLLSTLTWQCASAVVIASSFGLTNHLRRALAQGVADDYYIKPPERAQDPWSPNEELYHTVVNAYLKGQERLEKRWAEFLRAREAHQLGVQTSARIADHIAQKVSEGVGDVLAQADKLGRLLWEHFHIRADRDTDDPICQTLRELEKVAAATAQSAAIARGTGEAYAALEVKDLVAQVNAALDTLRAGLAFRRLTTTGQVAGELPIHTFWTEARGVLEEVLLYAIEASPEGGQLWIDVRRSTSGRGAMVEVRHAGELIATEIMDLIRSAHPLDPTLHARAWKLALVQWSAHNLGARLEFPDGKGTTITLHIPDTADDDPCPVRG